MAANWDSVASAFTYVSVVIGVLAVAVIAWWLIKRIRERRVEGSGLAGPR